MAASRKSGVSGERMVARVSRPESPRFMAPAACRRRLRPERISMPSACPCVGMVRAALHRHIDAGPSLPPQARVIDAEARGEQTRRNDDGVARRRRTTQTAHALADEIVAEAGDGGIGDDMAVVDLRIDELDRAESRAGSGRARAPSSRTGSPAFRKRA